METDVDDILGEYSDDIHEEFRDDNSHSIYNNNSLHFISNSTSVRLKCSEVGATEGCVSLSLLYWLKMLGIFLAVLLTLALMTLVTCRRPRKRGDIEIAQDCPTPVFEPEAPPGYEVLMETELRELPSYLEAVCPRGPVSSV